MGVVKRSDRTAWRRVENEVLIIASDSNSLTVLNETGARVWELLDGTRGRDELAQALSEEYLVDPPAARRDVDILLTELTSRGLVVEG